ncbi:MAG: hypothetical protein A2942_01740 [Candidatus Lloydbacteria bacterium RIFCSPLOWO2_01_FULL_50_20]|uniref:Phosphoribosyl-ATP pyrophosphohydrolase n=1 Tax=Candidatus Lloydbacteria bacterium RIFCSPLOWO2_01_FULL_50_20 TaxID=1798665 RepID=A0A1G2DEW1_9BACT|nr:MAG: hypothetical protein A2942_01740 [Candidatus Lloydbacteria bacterium RIFCSPLOWO2_01_FULL_50_20]
MTTKKYGKLVRDRAPRFIERDGGVPKTRTLSAEGFKDALLDKLVEEAGEVRKANGMEELIAELADVEEALKAIKEAYGIDPEQLEKIRKQRARVRGGFSKKIFLISVET